MSLKRTLTDIALAPMLFAAAAPMRFVRRYSFAEMPRAYGALLEAGVFPLRDHYYEPLFDTKNLKHLDKPRCLPAIDLNDDRQLRLLDSFSDLVGLQNGADGFGQNPNFWSGDAELWFHIIRHFKPRRIVEIGSGHSTLMARRAIARNRAEETSYSCDHICIEPYEMPWLEGVGVNILRKKLEDVELSFFDQLQASDILFIDSSHMIRPQGDVLIEYLQILPRLASGVVVHVHDIFTPRDYPMHFYNQPRFWNEQYLLEAFLSNNSAWEVLLAANMLKHEHYDLMRSKCIWITPEREPGSFYMRRL